MNKAVVCKYNCLAPLIEDHRTGDMVCSGCGLVIGDRIIDVSNEWFSEKDSRVGFAGDTSCTLATSAHKKNIEMRDSIANMCDKLHLPKSITAAAKDTYTSSRRNGFTNRQTMAIAVACIYAACLDMAPRTFKELSAASGVDANEILKTYSKMKKFIAARPKIANADDFIPRFCALLDLNFSDEKRALVAAANASNIAAISGRSPVVVAAASIYVASGELKCDVKTLAEVSGVAESSIVTVSKKLVY